MGWEITPPWPELYLNHSAWDMYDSHVRAHHHRVCVVIGHRRRAVPPGLLSAMVKNFSIRQGQVCVIARPIRVSRGQVCVIARPIRVGRRHDGWGKVRRASLCHRTAHPRRPLAARMGKSPQGKPVSSHGPAASSVSSADVKKAGGQVGVIARPIRVGRYQCGWEKVRTGGTIVLTVTCHPSTPPRPP